MGRILRPLAVLVLLALGAGGWYGWQQWSRAEELLRTGILSRVHELAPDLHVEIRRARFDFAGRVRLHDLVISSGAEAPPVVRVPDVMISVDRARLADQFDVLIRKVRLIEPEVQLVADEQGGWNWQQLQLPRTDQPFPEWEVQGGVVTIVRPVAPGRSSILRARQINASAMPAASRQFRFRSTAQVDQIGPLTLRGEIDLESGRWALDGQFRDITADATLERFAAESSPAIAAKLTEWNQTLTAWLPPTLPDHRGPHIASASGASPRGVAQAMTLPFPRQAPSLLGCTATLDVRFNLRQNPGDELPDYKLHVQASRGQMNHPSLPYPLSGVSGSVFVDNQRVVLKDVAAHNGSTALQLNASIDRDGKDPAQLQVRAEGLALDDRLRQRLPESLLKVYDSIRPQGLVDVAVDAGQKADGTWSTIATVTLRKCSISHVVFPYPVHDVSGTLRLHADDLIELEGRGFASGQPVRIAGWIRSPDDDPQIHLDVWFERVPIDETLFAACPPESRQHLRSLGLRGRGDGHCRITRAAGPDQPVDWELVTRLSDGSLEVMQFPYPLNRVEAVVTYAQGVWSCRDFVGMHGTSRITGSGQFLPSGPEEGLVDLQIAVEGGHLDESLRLALPPFLRDVWDEFQPTGRFRGDMRVLLPPGEPPLITISDLELTGGTVTLASFPWPLQHVDARLAWGDGFLEIRSFSGRHDDVQIRLVGNCEVGPEQWRLRFEELYIDDLLPDRSFRRALPAQLSGVVAQLDPQGPLSLAGRLELRGARHDERPLTAAWDLDTVFSGGGLQAGVELKHVHGRVKSRGRWDGHQAQVVGEIDVDRMVVLNHQISDVRGPFRLDNSRLVVGSEKIATGQQTDPGPSADRLTARAISGVLTFDAVAQLDAGPDYEARLTLSGARLDEYAARYLPGQSNLQGVINGWVDLNGQGSTADALRGNGQLQISPASLYELPVVAQIFSALTTLVPSDRTAFRYAFAEFGIADSRFDFSTIDLVGDAISLRGRGYARFDGKLNLDFYSMLRRNQVPVPFFGPLIGEATTGWVGIEVRGTTSSPIAKTRPVPRLDEALQRFLGTFDRQNPKRLAPPLQAPPRLTPPLRSTDSSAAPSAR